MQENFGEYTAFLTDLRTNGGKPLIVPKGRAAGCAAPADGAADPHGGTGTRESVSTGVSVPSVVCQGDRPHCASLGPVSALRACGYLRHADALQRVAEDVLACTTSQAAEAVRRIRAMGGWKETPHLPNFDPVINHSPHVTIVQLRDSHGSNTHVIAIAGDLIFDSNHPEPRSLSKAALDACCLGAATFARVSYAVRFIPAAKALKRERMAAAGRVENKVPRNT